MTTKHQPATPLPWEKRGDEFSYIASLPAAPSVISIKNHDDAAYIAHAANVYPQLVAALRAAPLVPFHGSNNGERWDEGYKAGFNRALNDVHALARALLASIGEDA